MAEDDIIQRIIVTAVDQASAVFNSSGQTVSGVVQKITSTFSQTSQGMQQFATSAQQAGKVVSSSFAQIQAAAQLAGLSIEQFGKLSQQSQQQYIANARPAALAAQQQAAALAPSPS